VASNGADYLVTWQESGSGVSNSSAILGVQVGPEGPSGLGPLLHVDSNDFNHAHPAHCCWSEWSVPGVNQGYQSLVHRIVASFVNSEALPRLDSSAWLSNGQFQFRFRGAVGECYAIQASQDLRTWNRLWTFVNAQPQSY